MSKVFLRRGDYYSQVDENFEVTQTLDEGIYQIHQNPMTLEITLERIADEFHFGYKLYGIDETLISHVLNTYNKQPTKRNIGVLLNGAKGTGKTVTAKLLANKLGLPIILCDKPYIGLSNYLAGIKHDCVFLFDEFEKSFRADEGRNNNDDNENRTGEDLLSIMDGVYNSDHCHVFILTTNELKVNDCLISRPSRIRYLKSFGKVIDRKILEEFVDDNLKYPEYKTEILDFIDTLTTASIDVVKSIVEEVNIHKCHVDDFKSIFNVKESNYHYYTRWYSYYPDDNEVTVQLFLKKAKSVGRTSDDDDWRPNFGDLHLKKPFANLKVGEMIDNYWKIKEILPDKNVLICENTRYRGEEGLFYIENPNAKPNLYDGEGSAYAYGYYDF